MATNNKKEKAQTETQEKAESMVEAEELSSATFITPEEEIANLQYEQMVKQMEEEEKRAERIAELQERRMRQQIELEFQLERMRIIMSMFRRF